VPELNSGAILLPWPPSTNAIYRAFRGRAIKAKPYRQWIEEAGWEIKRQRPMKHTGPVSIEIELVPPDGRAFDLDNRLKAILDALVTSEVIPNDDADTVVDLRVRRGLGFVGARVEVRPA
jgi:crossover junction endodeoxyribonuclease RusA